MSEHWPRPWVKLCGMTRPEDADAAAALGATMVGINFWPHSARYVEVERAVEIAQAVAGKIPVVGVFVNEETVRIDEIAAEVGLDLIQLHGDEPSSVVAEFGSRAIRALRLESSDSFPSMESSSFLSSSSSSSFLESEVFCFLIDAPAGARYGGTGVEWDWLRARDFVARTRVPVLIAGGIGPGNARKALAASGAAGVDLASGVESAPGIKDLEKMKRLFEEVRVGEK